MYLDEHVENDGQENSLERINFNNNLISETPHIQSHQSGFVAAGFKKFVKKSISIRLKTTDSLISGIKQDDSKNVETNDKTLHSQLVGKNLNQSPQSFDNYHYDVDTDDYNEVRKELNSILESQEKENKKIYSYIQENKTLGKNYSKNSCNKSVNKDISFKNVSNQTKKFIEINSYHDYENFINAVESSCDYDYDLGDDISNSESENEENNNNNKKNSEFIDSDASTYCSSCIVNNDYIANNLTDNIESNSTCSSFSLKNSLSPVEKNLSKEKNINEKNSTNGVQIKQIKTEKSIKLSKKKQNKSNRIKKIKNTIVNKDFKKFEAEKNPITNIMYFKETLKNILEMHILNLSDDDDDIELKDILMSLLSEIITNESITLEECAFIQEKISELNLKDSYNESLLKENYLKTKMKNKMRNKDVEFERKRKRKRKEKAKNNKKKRTSYKKNMTDEKFSGKEIKVNINKTNRKSKKTNIQQENFYIDYNGNGEIMEAGEIDDMYDDEIIVERELENLLTRGNLHH